MNKHQARPVIVGFKDVVGIRYPVKVWSETCQDCGRPVREMFHLSQGGTRNVFYHSAGKVQPGDARLGARRPEHSAAISAGMKAANERRRLARA